MFGSRFAGAFLAVLMVVAAAESFAGELAQASGTKLVVRIGITTRPEPGLVLAQARGYFTELGLDAQMTEGGRGAQDFLGMLATGQIDVVTGATNAGVFNAMNRGIDVRIVADSARVGMKNDRGFALIVRQDLLDSGAVKSVADLKGRALAGGPGRGAYNEIFTVKLLAAAGMKPADLDIKYLTFQDGFAALANKSVDAALLIEPTVTTAMERKMGNVLVLVSDVDAGAQLGLVYYSAQFTKQTEAATKFLVAFLRAQREINDAFFEGKDQDAVIDTLAKNMLPRDPAVWKKIQAPYRDLNGDINVEDIKRQAAFYKETGTVLGPVPEVEKFVDLRFIQEAQKILGRR